MGILIVFIWWYIGYISICILDKIYSKITKGDMLFYDASIVLYAFGGLIIPITVIILLVIGFLIALPRKILGLDE